MGRRETPLDPKAGPVHRLAWQLRQLREQAGSPSYRVLARRAHYSASTLAEAAKGERLPSLEVTLAYAEACGGDAGEWRARWSATAKAMAASPAPLHAEERCPYQGLTSFQPEQAQWFFGRSELVDRLRDRVERLPLSCLIGASGSGKSSLLRAGLLGTIAADQRATQRWRTILMTPTEHPIEALSAGLAKLSGQDVEQVREALTEDPAGLDITIRSALAASHPDTRALLVVDQFEEIFTLCADRDERRRFVEALLDATQGSDRRTTVILGVRADFLAHLIKYPGLADALGDEGHLLVGPVSTAELREIVTRPAAQVGMGVDPDLLTTVLADAADEPGALPMVSHALLETWQRRSGPTLTLSAYHASGGVRAAVAQTAERVYAEFGTAEKRAARRIFLRLTALGDGTEDTRRPVARAELEGIADSAVTIRVLDQLAEARLVVLGDGTVSVAHEALISAWPRLHRWLSDDRASLLTHRRLTDAAHTWTSLHRDPGALYRGAQLVAARAFADDRHDELNQHERDFLHASNALADAEQNSARRHARLLKRLVAGVSVLLVLALLGGAVAVRQRQDARRQQVVALSSELSLQARSLLATDAELAGLLAVEADHLHSSTETRGSVLSAAAAPRHTALNVGGPSIYAVAFNPDHSLLASAAADGVIGLWDPARGTRVATLSGHTGRVANLAFVSDGRLLVSVGVDGTNGSVIVWDIRTRQQVTRLSENNLASGTAFSADGTMVALGLTSGADDAAASKPGDIALHDLRSGTRTLLRGHHVPVASLTFSHDGKLLVSANGSEHPTVWDVARRRPIAHLPTEHIFSVAFGHSDRVLAGLAHDRGVYLWDLGDDQPAPLPPLPLSGRYAWSISAPVGNKLAVADENGAITIWDLRRREPLQTYQDRGRSETASVALSQDAAMLASAGFNGTIVLHDIGNAPFAGFTAQVKDVKVSPDGLLIASAGSDRTVRLWDAHGKTLTALNGHPDEVQAVAFSPNGRLLAAVTRNNIVTIWDVRSRTKVTRPFLTTGVGASTDIDFDPGGRILATATLGPDLWDVTDMNKPSEITDRFPARIVTSLAFTPDGRRLLGASVGGYVNTWDITTGKLINRVNTQQSAVQDIVVSPDGSWLATAGDSRTIKLWDAVTGRETAVLSGHTAPVQVLAVSRDGRRLASAGDDHTIHVWDTRTRQHVATLTGHRARIRGLAFTPTGNLISGAEDGRIISWSFDLHAAKAQICAAADRNLTRQEWATHISSRPYKPSCAAPPRR
ncbi:helix-turn-helix domain-containing protein [Micromonospora krabiensis]|uniref:WD40 repeat n=1 Tax=Micromonospora krabiensis TaxID=307121 RepID=A0A1C3MX03_9ACTN|nr:helix-turn-helix domain-containing protein [Micromonospora krabiensis]SBV24853.1 WD40 repeat [Micromonospora krabiensis]